MHPILTHTEPNGRTEGKYDRLELFECDECGAAVSDPDLHTHWHAAQKTKKPKREACPSCGNWTVTNNRCNGCRKPFIQCDCQGSGARR